ncbi:MAG: UTP:GlnB [Solirubrobacterales bacterium]|jgi:HD superfamily phosphodiesterase|nr:UTP:GlnB [Solirubrobacterales bacterium]
MTATSHIAIPDSRLAREANELIRSVEPDLLYNHSLRVYAFGALQGRRRGIGYDPELLFIGAMFHDIGLVEGHRSADDRFEVDGANAAREFLAGHGVTGEALRIVWDAIALHTTPGIPEHKEPEVALVTAGVELDVLGFGYDDISPEDRDAVLAAYPRVDFKESIIQAFADGMAHRPETAFGTVNADVLAEKLPGYEPPNFCAIIRGSKHAN